MRPKCRQADSLRSRCGWWKDSQYSPCSSLKTLSKPSSMVQDSTCCTAFRSLADTIVTATCEAIDMREYPPRMTPNFSCRGLKGMEMKTFFRPSCMSVSITFCLISNRPSWSMGPPNVFDPPCSSEKSSGSGTVPIEKQEAVSTAASSLALISLPKPAASCSSDFASGLMGEARTKTLKSRHRLMSSTRCEGLGWPSSNVYFPGGTSISSEFR
mmetsp:Transcript_32549/g.59156  ORF Transcript_32549/g.59156 Transcript_32549/m.59156 type:complete len:213 (-) Transcript_32549:718-1356(-)